MLRSSILPARSFPSSFRSGEIRPPSPKESGHAFASFQSSGSRCNAFRFTFQLPFKIVSEAAQKKPSASADGSSRRMGKPKRRSEEHTSELQSLMRISYAVFCLKKKKHTTT